MHKLRDRLYAESVPLRKLGRAVDLCEPCLGIGGYRMLAEYGEFPYGSPASKGYDTDSRLKKLHRELSFGATIKIGEAGNLVTSNVREECKGCEGLVIGPPCQHLNATGGRGGVTDEARHVVFETALQWVIELAWGGELVFFVIENTPNIEHVAVPTSASNGATRHYSDFVLETLRTAIPFFAVGASVEQLKPVLPISRWRWWCRGIRDLPLSPNTKGPYWGPPGPL